MESLLPAPGALHWFARILAPPAALVPEQGPPVAIRHLPVLNALRTMRTKGTHAGISTKGAAPREATWILGAILTHSKCLIRWVLVFNKPKDISQVCDKGLRAVCTVHIPATWALMEKHHDQQSRSKISVYSSSVDTDIPDVQSECFLDLGFLI